ncbi:class I SAM-dependent methyltransferase [Nocardioides speluncae]|uniref:class I SAM-dependent methyltransferase n=1 Tax=Nocardioides speluncae TaxID=2670337 RepID=UPI00137A3CA2|nr:class I SAM-dependent methyltransferase [Nocardioides speluncae]
MLQSLLYQPVHETVLTLLHQHPPPQCSRALDIGCGTGRLVCALQQLVPVVVGVDVSERMLAEAATYVRNDPSCLCAAAAYVCAAAEQLPFGSGSFDVVTTTLSLRHWQDPDRGIKELVRVLSPDGVVVIADADIGEQALRARRWLGGRARGRQLGLLLDNWGMDVVERRLAPVRGPIPSIHVLLARRRRSGR